MTQLIDKLQGNIKPVVLEELASTLHSFEPNLVDVDILQIEGLRPLMSPITATSWISRIQEIGAIIAALRERELARIESRRIRAAYLIWRERYKIIEVEDSGNETEAEIRREQAFAEQVSYVFFVRLLLTRVLEDKGIMPHLISDGGFSVWYSFLKDYAIDSVDELGGESLLPLVYRRVAGFYRHFFQQPIFDWFLPDDYLLALVLHHLSKYNFKDVTSDLLGFTYEAFIDRVARNKKGHFLTPPSVVEFMLDRAGYNTPSIIGEKLLDTACGSGSFLVHAARRLRQVLASAMSAQDATELARTFIDQIQTKLVGLEINPFSCYLAELNLFIQVLDDLALLWKQGEHPNIECFAIYNTNSLEMPQAVLQSERNKIATSFEQHLANLDEAFPIKVQYGNFGYVICNPPYINRGIIAGAKSYGEFPFYREVVKGDENFYLLFLRLAAYYVAPGGSICFICPLNLLGDESTMRAREMFNGTDWSLQSITRFYARNVLFPGVLQGVCVVRFDHLPGQPANTVEIRGGYSVLDPYIPIPPTVKDYRSSLWVQRQVQRIANLTQTETAIFLKEVSGLEMKRPIRGTIIQRDGQHPVVADETVLVMYTLDAAYEQLACATFGLLTSQFYNFLFSLFSTNAHANFKEILRLPIPDWSFSLEKQLADATKNVLQAYDDLHIHEDTYGTVQGEHVSINKVLMKANLQVLRLEELVLRRDVILHGTPQFTLDVLLNRNQLTLNPGLPPDAMEAITRTIQANGTAMYTKGGKDILIPHPKIATTFLAQLHVYEQERIARVEAIQHMQQELDEMVIHAYGITNTTWKERIAEGVPWASN